jgi:hypothetical protein
VKNAHRVSRLSHECPRYSPDGRFIAILTQNLRRSPVDANRVAIIERAPALEDQAAAGGRHSCAAAVGYGVVGACSSAPRKTRGRACIGFPGREGAGARRPRRHGERLRAIAGGIAFVRSTMSTPPAVFWNAARAKRASIGSMTTCLAARKMGEVREFRIKGWKGDEVQMWAIYPPDFDPRRSGRCCTTSTGARTRVARQLPLPLEQPGLRAQGYVVVCVNYHGSSSFGQDFLSRSTGVGQARACRRRGRHRLHAEAGLHRSASASSPLAAATAATWSRG